MNRAKAIADAYRPDAVPTLYVDGKFVVYKVPTREMMPVVDALIIKARGERPKG